MLRSKCMSLLLIVVVTIISGCDTGGSGNNSSTYNSTGVANPSSTAGSLQTSIGSQAVCKLIINSNSSNMCSVDASIAYPAGATFDTAISSGIANGSLISANPSGNTLKIALASGTSFTSGEVATIYFNLNGSVQASEFSVSTLIPHACP